MKAAAVTQPARIGSGVNRRSEPVRNRVGRLLLNLLLIAVSAVALVPLFWMLSTSLKAAGTEYEFPPRWIPVPIILGNYLAAHETMNYVLYYRNTITIAVLATAGAALTSTAAGFAFARLRFVGRDVLFLCLLSTMMLPNIVTLIPTYIIFRTVGWIDTFLPLVVPSWLGGGAFYIFLARQFFMTIPPDLDEAARMDGAGTFRIYWQILIPLAGSVLAVIATFTFVDHWTEFLRPLIYLNRDEVRTVALAIALNKGVYTTRLNYLMASSMVMTLPIIFLFFFAQRYFMKGIVLTGLTGR